MHYIFKNILVTVSCLLSLSAVCQRSVIDSLKKLSISTNNDSIKALYFSKIGKEYWFISPDTSLQYTNQSFELASKKNIKGLFPYCQNNFGVLKYLAGNYHEALECYFKGLKFSKSNPIIHCILLNNIGMVYQELKDYEKAKKYYLETLISKKERRDSIRFANTYNSIGIVYTSLHQSEIAKLYFDSSYYYGKKFENPYAEADALGNIASYYTRKKDFINAEFYCRRALSIKQKLEDVYGVATSCSDLAAILLNQNKDKEAESFLLQGEKLALQNSYLELLVPLYQNMSDYYRKKGEYKQALFFITKTIAIKDSILTDGKIREAAIKEKEFTFSVKQASDSLKNEAERLQTQVIHEKELYKQRLFVYGAIILAVLMLAVAIVVFRAFKEKQKSNRIIEQQKLEVENQKALVEEHQKETLDSITYARRIQYALLAKDLLLKENLEKHFVLFKPKDIVSGDFYWATENNNKFYLAVCDSTGHGVPGAFMSLLNIGFLSEAIKEKGIDEPNEVLNYVRERLISSIGVDGQKDGMDCILLCINKTTKEITYSAANNAPVLISNNEIIDLDKNRMPVGKGERNDSFTLYQLDYSKGDMLYLYTDGYADQFGGPKGKKFKYKALNELLLKHSTLPMEEQRIKIETEFDNWKGDLEQVDDVCMIGIKL